MSSARWVVLDVGETLIDETRVFHTWAGIFGLPDFTLMGVLGGSIANANEPEEWRRFFELIQQPEWRAHQPAFDERYGTFRADDLYPDALRAIESLKARGYRVAITANQPARRTAELRALGVELDVMAMSDEMGLHKPDPAFFQRTLELIGSPNAGDVAYVGDRVDNDVVPSAAAGMRAIWIRRGPWGFLHEDENGTAALVVRSLDELVERIDEAWSNVRTGGGPRGLPPPPGR